MFAGKKSAQIREILISESAWEEMTCLFAPSLEQFLAADEDAYFEQALAWTEKREELNTIRLTMRERFEKKRNQVTEPARTFEATLRTVWENYCSGHRPKSFVVDGDDHNAEEN
ncbi:hypothetical protein [Enterobacter cloacae]|uniref:hypothetical protein n=1 Tax=Enterobacter cloacae TaxID=550 RepID=UPI0031D9282F